MSTGTSNDAPLEVLQRLQTLLLSLDNVESYLQKVVETAADVIEPPVSCGLTVRYDDQPVTVVSSDDRAAVLDERQYASGGGPCLEAMRTGDVVDVPDLRTESRWSSYVSEARLTGLRCVIAFPLIVSDVSVGALNVYGFERPGLFTVDRRRALQMFAALAAGCIPLATDRVREATLRAQLEEALVSRSHIDQAVGVLMGQQGCSAEEAFGLLRRRSQTSNQPLRQVAVTLLARTVGRAPAAPRAFQRD